MKKGRLLPFAGLALPLAAELVDAAAVADNDGYDDDIMTTAIMMTTTTMMMLITTMMMMLVPSLISEPAVLDFQF